MRTPTSVCLVGLLAVGLAGPASALAQEQEPRISALSAIDRNFMETQREDVDALARTHLGRQVRGQKDNDLEVLQQLLDSRLVKPEETVMLQGMGVVMGDLLAEELGLRWVIFEDQLGRSRALRLGETNHFLYPITMISRRYEVGAAVDVRAIYNRAVELMQPHLPAKPFQ